MSYKLIKADQVVYDLGNAYARVDLQNVFTTEYDCYKLFVTYTGNQNTYKFLRLMNSSGVITTSTYSYNSNLWYSTGYSESDNTGANHAGLTIGSNTQARAQRYMGKLAMTIWQPANTSEKTLIFTAGFSDNAASANQSVMHCASENTYGTAVTGISFLAYGIGEDIENVSYELYGVEL